MRKAILLFLLSALPLAFAGSVTKHHAAVARQTIAAGGGTPPNYQATGTALGGSGNVSWPTHQSGDIGVLLVSESANDGDVATPSGWTELIDAASGGETNSNDGKLQVFYRTAAGSSEADVTLSLNNRAVSQIITVRGASSVARLGVDDQAAESNSVSLTSGTTGADNALVLALVATTGTSDADQISSWTNANLSSVTDIPLGRRSFSGVVHALEACWGELSSSGSAGTTTATAADSGAEHAGGHLEFLP